MQKRNQTTRTNLTNSTVNSMLNVLNDLLRKDLTLANELLMFLKERNVEVPVLSNTELSQLIPVSFKQRNSSNQMGKLRTSFEGIETAEFIL